MNTIASAMILGVCALGLAALSSSRAGADEAKKNPVIVIDTSLGKFKAELWADKAPGTVETGYIRKHYVFIDPSRLEEEGQRQPDPASLGR
jgi:hypothetical protein